MLRRLVLVAALAIVAGCGGSGHHAAPAGAAAATATKGQAPAHVAASGHDWTRFGYNAARTNVAKRGPTAAQVQGMHARAIHLPGTVDSSPIFLHDVRVKGARHDLLVMTTTYGRTIALDARSGHELWRFTPGSYGRLAGTYQITTATPVADPSRKAVYTASPDGRIHKLRVSNGHQEHGWPVRVTRLAQREKIPSALNFAHGHVLVTTGGYIGDVPPYQGKVVSIKGATGHISHVWNSLCSHQRHVIDPSSCSASDSAIWGRGGAVVAPHTHRIYVATGNAPFNGSTNWGDSVLELRPLARSLRRHYTPFTQAQLNLEDRDLGSASPALLPAGRSSRPKYVLQGGKDGRLRLLSLKHSFHHVHGAAGHHTGGEVQTLPQPGGVNLVSAPLVWHHGRTTETVVATTGGTVAYQLRHGRLHQLWASGAGGTSPVMAGRLLYVYDPGGALNVFRPRSGKLVHHFSAPAGHWNSPIVADGRIYLPSGNANNQVTTGLLWIYG
jgi:hypothetical protein